MSSNNPPTRPNLTIVPPVGKGLNTVSSYQTVKAATPRRFQALTITDILELPDQDWIMQGLIPEDSIIGIYGEPGDGKSFLVLSWFFHLAAGETWLGREIKPSFVFYTVGEGMRGYKRRLKALLTYHHSFDRDTLRQNFRMFGRSVHLGNSEDIHTYIQDVLAQLPTPRPAMWGLCLDTLFQCAPGEDVNSPGVMSKLMDAVKYIKMETGADFIIVIHHRGKNRSMGAMGSMVYKANVDVLYELELDKDTRVITLKSDKMKDEDTFTEYFTLEKVVYGNGRSSCVISGCTDVPKRKEETKGRGASTQKDRMLDLLSDEGLTYTAWRLACIDAGIPANTFSKYRNKLLDEHKIRQAGPLYRREIDPNTDLCGRCGGQSWIYNRRIGGYTCVHCNPDQMFTKD